MLYICIFSNKFGLIQATRVSHTMIPIIQINFLLFKMEAGKNRVGSKRERGRERKRGAD